MSKIKFLPVLLALFAFSFSSPVMADEEVRSLIVDLKSKGFTQSVWQENLDSSNIIFAPGDKFQVQLRIENKGNRNQTNIKVTPRLPSTVTADVSSFTLNQIVPNQEWVKDITLTVKDGQYVNKELSKSTFRVDITSDVDTTAGDYTSFYTSNGTKKVATSSSNRVLPVTGASPLVTGSLIGTSLLGLAYLLRRLARGY